MPQRCKSVFKRLNSRCILEDGHFARHAYPNALLKKERPEEWERLQKGKETRWLA